MQVSDLQELALQKRKLAQKDAADKTLHQMHANLLLSIVSDIKYDMSKPKPKKGADDCYARIRKYLSNANENLSLSTTLDNIVTYTAEVEFLTSLLPVQMTPEEIEKIVIDNDIKNIGQAMGYFKKNYDGNYQPKDVAKVMKTID